MSHHSLSLPFGISLCLYFLMQAAFRFKEVFMWDACKDLTLIILMVAAAVSLALGITTEVGITSVVL